MLLENRVSNAFRALSADQPTPPLSRTVRACLSRLSQLKDALDLTRYSDKSRSARRSALQGVFGNIPGSLRRTSHNSIFGDANQRQAVDIECTSPSRGVADDISRSSGGAASKFEVKEVPRRGRFFGADLGRREPELMDRGVKNTDPAASMDGFTAARAVSSGSRWPHRAVSASMSA